MGYSMLEDGKYKFSSEYGTAVKVVLPQIMLLALNYVLLNWVSVNETALPYVIISLILSTVVGFITLKATIQFVRNERIDFAGALSDTGSFVQYVVYSIIVFGITYFLNKYAELNLDVIYVIVEPFGNFLMGATSIFGFTLRFLIVLDFMLLLYTLIIGVLLSKFLLIPYAVCDGKNILEAFRTSWDNTTDNIWEIVKVCIHLMVKVIIVLNAYIILVFNVNSMGGIDFITFVMAMTIIFWILPLGNTLFGVIYHKLG